MNVLFITLIDIDSINEHGIYTDLMRKFVENGHNVYVVSPTERRNKKPTGIIENGNSHILKIKTGNIQKTNIIEKGISTILIEYQIAYRLLKYFSSVQFDLILYSTPPITIVAPIKYIKRRDHAKTYLMLKDIFPQNAVDLNMMTKHGAASILYYHFRNKEKELYKISDKIGCMSPANIDFVLNHNKFISSDKVELCPNCMDFQDYVISEAEKIKIREKYNIPLDKTVFVYGGNLGKPQGIPFIIDCLKEEKDNGNVFFLIVGSGTEYSKIEAYINSSKQPNVKLMAALPKEDYEKMICACDVGLIFLDYRFTIPNFPSRLLSYMQSGIPVLACTDKNTDIGTIVSDNGFGWECYSNDVEQFKKTIDYIVANKDSLSKFGDVGKKYLLENYNEEIDYNIIISSVRE